MEDFKAKNRGHDLKKDQELLESIPSPISANFKGQLLETVSSFRLKLI